MSKRMLSILLISVVTATLSAQQVLVDVVYLKNGSIIKGTIIEQVPGETIKLKTADGSIFVYNMSEIKKITKEQVNNNSRNYDKNVVSMMRYQNEISSLQGRKRIDLLGIGGVYLLTVLGDFMVGGDVGTGTLIPVVGPFVEIVRVDNDPNYQWSPSGKPLMILSGIIQTGLALDYIFANNKLKRVKSKYSMMLGFNQDEKYVLFAYAF